MLRAIVTLLGFAGIGVLLALGALRLQAPRVHALEQRLGDLRTELSKARSEQPALGAPTNGTSVAASPSDAARSAEIEARSRRRVAAARVRAVALALDVGALAQAGELLASERAGSWELEHLRLRLGRSLREFEGHGLLVNDLDLAGDRLVSAGADGTVRLWSLGGEREVAILRSESTGYLATALAREAEVVVAGDEDGFACLWDVSTTKLVARVDTTGGSVRTIDVDARGARFATGGADGVARLWTREGQLLDSWTGHDGEINGIAITADGERVLTGSDDGTAILWQHGEPDPVEVLAGHEGWIRAVALSPDGLRAATASDDTTVRVWDLASSRTEVVLEGHEAAVLDVHFAADGHRLLTASDDATIRLWDRHLGEELTRFRWAGATVERALASDDRGRVAFTTYDESVRVWNRLGESGRLELATDLGEIRAAAARDGVVLAGGSLGAVRLWDTNPAGAPGGAGVTRSFEVGVAAVTALALAPNGKEFAVALADRSVVRVAASDGVRLARFDGFSRPVRALAYTGEAELAVITEDGEIARLRGSEESGERIPGPRTQLLGVALAPDGSRAAWADAAGTVRVRGTTDGTVLAGSRIDRFARVDALALAPGANALFLGLQEGAIARFDLDDERPPLFFVGHERGVTALAHDSSGERLASAGRDRTVRIWDGSTGDELLSLLGPRAQVTTLCFDAGVGTLIAGCSDGRLLVWPRDESSYRAWRTF